MNGNTNNSNNSNRLFNGMMLSWWNQFDSRVQSALLMAVAMALHYGGYEFLRNSILALFTSSETGFVSPAAYPLANGLVSPFSVLFLYLYGRQLESRGPRTALQRTTLWSISYILFTCITFKCLQFPGIQQQLPTKVIGQFLIGLSFLFQNSYNYLIATQQWSFVDSILTPEEGSRWFTIFTGTTSLFCTLTGSLVPYIVPRTGLLGLLALTSITLTGTMLFQDRAYQMAQDHGFDPSSSQMNKKKKKLSKRNEKDKSDNNDPKPSDKDNTKEKTMSSKALDVFRRVPTLRALFIEVISFQSLNTILTVALVESVKKYIPNDIARSAYTSQFYALVNGSSAAFQFGILPFCMKRVEPKYIWRCMPLVPFMVCSYQLFLQGNVSLSLLAFAVFITKTMDYSIRSVVYNMVYQPLDYDCRYLGKEIIGVFGSRFGKSGMSLFISGLSYIGIIQSSAALKELSYISWCASTVWISSTWWLSTLIPTKAVAQKIVEERIYHNKNDESSTATTTTTKNSITELKKEK